MAGRHEVTEGAEEKERLGGGGGGESIGNMVGQNSMKWSLLFYIIKP